MSLRIRRGTDAQRQGVVFDLGEPIWTQDTKKLFVGDGITAGGNNILANSAGTGLTWNNTTQAFDVTGGGGGGGGGITAIVQDTNPNLGGNLILNGNNISGAGNISITGNISSSGTANFSAGLGGDLNLNSYSIVGTGNIAATNSLTITSNTGTINIGTSTTPSGLTINSERQEGLLNLRTIGGGQLIFLASSGTLATPTSLTVNDSPGGIKFKVLNALGNYNSAGGIFCQFNGPALDLTNPDSLAKGTIAFVTGFGATTYYAKFTSLGVFNAPIFQATSYSTGAYPAGGEAVLLSGVTIGASGSFTCSGTTLLLGAQVDITGTNSGTGSVTNGKYYIITTNGTTSFTLSATGNGSAIATVAGSGPTVGLTFRINLPLKGSIIFDSSTNKFMGYNGTNWVAFSGP
jgi:hypothetical protein